MISNRFSLFITSRVAHRLKIWRKRKKKEFRCCLSWDSSWQRWATVRNSAETKPVCNGMQGYGERDQFHWNRSPAEALGIPLVISAIASGRFIAIEEPSSSIHALFFSFLYLSSVCLESSFLFCVFEPDQIQLKVMSLPATSGGVLYQVPNTAVHLIFRRKRCSRANLFCKRLPSALFNFYSSSKYNSGLPGMTSRRIEQCMLFRTPWRADDQIVGGEFG